MLLSDAIQLFLDRYIKVDTRKGFEYPLRQLMGYIGPNRPIADISAVDIERWNNTLRTPERNLAIASQDKYRIAVKTFFNYLVKINQIEASPAHILKRERRREQVPKERAMPDKKLAQLMSYCKWKKSKRDIALVCFLADSGARIGEAETLLIEKIEWENNRAWIDGKSGGRYVPFFEESARWMKEWLLQRTGKNPYLFSKSKGKKPQVNLNQEFRRACLAAGIGSWGPHSLRHRKGWQYSDSGISATVAQQQFGHSDVKITLDNYYPHDWERVNDAAKKLSLPSSTEEETKVIHADFRKTK